MRHLFYTIEIVSKSKQQPLQPLLANNVTFFSIQIYLISLSSVPCNDGDGILQLLATTTYYSTIDGDGRRGRRVTVILCVAGYPAITQGVPSICF